ncbi:MAG: hypothetical protein FWD01_05610 [Defluviitaleaceae bacterium]|nr:hypothetical protein [Defluviitaleaceae bacterium]
MKDNVALMAKVFDFLNQLDEDQIDDLLDDKVQLRLDMEIDKQIDALIDEKLSVRVFEEFIALIEGRVAARILGNTDDEDFEEDMPRRNSRRNQKKNNIQRNGRRDVAPRRPNGKSINTRANDIKAIANEIKAIDTREDILDYFDNNPLKISTVKSLANKHFDIPGTNVMNKEDLINKIIEAALSASEITTTAIDKTERIPILNSK